MLMAPNVWASIEQGVLAILKDLAAARAIPAESLDGPVLIACLCGVLAERLDMAEGVTDAAATTCSILARLSEQGGAKIACGCLSTFCFCVGYAHAIMYSLFPASNLCVCRTLLHCKFVHACRQGVDKADSGRAQHGQPGPCDRQQ